MAASLSVPLALSAYAALPTAPMTMTVAATMTQPEFRCTESSSTFFHCILCRYSVACKASEAMDVIGENMAKRHQVIIIGGGPVGVGLAVNLGLRGISCALVERRVGLQNIPKGQNLAPRTLEHFHRWGC